MKTRILGTAALATSCVVAAAVATPMAAGAARSTPQAAAATCSYHSWGPYFPQRTVAGDTFTDGSVWIALRRDTGCNYYTVVASRLATGKSACLWDIRSNITGTILESGNCAKVPGVVYSQKHGNQIYGELTTKYPDRRVYYARTPVAP
jgi:hypothetical protein